MYRTINGLSTQAGGAQFFFGVFFFFFSLSFFLCLPLILCNSRVRYSLTNVISILKLSSELKLAKGKEKRIYSVAVSFKLLYLLIGLSHAKHNFNNIESTG